MPLATRFLLPALVLGSMLGLTSTAVCAGEPEPEVAAAPDEPDEPIAQEVDEEAAQALQGVLVRLDPSTRAAFEAMDDAQRQALFEKFERGDALTEQEQAIADAFASSFAEQFEGQLDYQTGDVEVGMGLAMLHLGEDFRYLGPEQADRILVEAWGNPPGSGTLGMIFPADVSPLDPDQGWGIVIQYSADGHVEDDDADDIDYDELLEQMQEGAQSDNAARRAEGFPAVHLVGWAEPPHYDPDTHRLYWAKELDFEGAPQHTLNYAIRVLGRRGVLELNAVSSMDQLPRIKPAMETVLSRVEFNAGNRYQDFDPDLDQVAAYGIGGLIAGKVLAKAGIFAAILKSLVAAKKLLVLFVLGAVVAVKRWFGRSDA